MLQVGTICKNDGGSSRSSSGEVNLVPATEEQIERLSAVQKRLVALGDDPSFLQTLISKRGIPAVASQSFVDAQEGMAEKRERAIALKAGTADPYPRTELRHWYDEFEFWSQQEVNAIKAVPSMVNTKVRAHLQRLNDQINNAGYEGQHEINPATAGTAALAWKKDLMGTRGSMMRFCRSFLSWRQGFARGDYERVKEALLQLESHVGEIGLDLDQWTPATQEQLI